MMVKMPEEIERIFSDYKLNLVQVRESEQYRFCNEDVKTVFEVSREIFNKNFDKIYELYGNRDIGSELIAMIGMITDSSSLIRQGENKEVRNMCTALEELQNESRQEGRREGKQEGRQEGRLITVKIYQEAKGNPDYSKEQIAKKVGCTVQEVEDTLAMFDM